MIRLRGGRGLGLALLMCTTQALGAGPPSGTDRWSALAQRCQQAMLAGTCRALSSQPPSEAGAPRVFVAGVGEVDARAYEALRRHGEAMCGEAEQQCRRDAGSATCRIAQALYPAAVPAVGLSPGSRPSR